MPQRPDPTPVAEWRAEPEHERYGGTWAVFDSSGKEIAFGLDEPTAKRIANAPAKERLCEELADALEALTLAVAGHGFSLTPVLEPHFVEPTEKAIAALTKAGRAPQ